ncbi:hypothetical protein [Neobacillus sp. Marseille-QA0830]
MRKIYYAAGLGVIVLTACLLLTSLGTPKAQESITYFPIEPNVTYKKSNTAVSLADQKSTDWKINSILDRKAYLRQDAGLLFQNGRLIGKLGEWKQNTASISQEKRFPAQTGLLQAVTFHHAELHEGDKILSSQAMSEDALYVIAQPPNSVFSFRSPTTNAEREWKQRLDEQTERMLYYSWNKGVRHFSIPLSEYQAYPLPLFNNRAKTGLPGFSKEASDKITGQLWEGLYKNYFLGIKKQDGTTVPPIGSTIPLILLAKNQTHLLVLTETKDGSPILLRQMIAAGY